MSVIFTKAYAREQEEGVHNNAGVLGRVKNILAASTREHWEAHGSRLWVHKGYKELKIVDLTDDVRGACNSKKSGLEAQQELARSPSGLSFPSAKAHSCWLRSQRFWWTGAGRSYLGPAKRRTAGSWSLAGSTTFAG